jgi:hypothetical protein
MNRASCECFSWHFGSHVLLVPENRIKLAEKICKIFMQTLLNFLLPEYYKFCKWFTTSVNCSDELNSSTYISGLTYHNVKALLLEDWHEGAKDIGLTALYSYVLHVTIRTELSQSLDASHRNVKADFRIASMRHFALSICAANRWKISLQAKATRGKAVLRGVNFEQLSL